MAKLTLDTASAIITRQFDLADGGHVNIFVWKPEIPGDDYPTCKYLIRGLGDDKVREVSGVDGVDALMTALQTISTLLYHSPEYKAGKLTWLGEKDLHLPLLPGDQIGKEEYGKASLLTLVGERSVLAMPGTRFPYIAWPGGRLQRLILRLKKLIPESDRTAEFKAKLTALTEHFVQDQKYYEAVCLSKGFDTSYVEEPHSATSDNSDENA